MFALFYQSQALVWGDPVLPFAIGIFFALLLMADWSQVSRRQKAILRTVLALAGTASALAIIWWPCWLYPFCDGGGGGW
jgi:hypothetical protein